MSDTHPHPHKSHSNGKDASHDAGLPQAAAEYVQDAVEQVRASAGDVVNQGSAELKRASEGSVKFIKENPGLAVAGALGLGVLLGLSLRNRY